MTDILDPRLEAAARAMARHRLAVHSFSSTLTPDLIAELLQLAEERMWPTLLDEAQVAVEAADGAAQFARTSAIEHALLPSA